MRLLDDWFVYCASSFLVFYFFSPLHFPAGSLGSCEFFVRELPIPLISDLFCYFVRLT